MPRTTALSSVTSPHRAARRAISMAWVFLIAAASGAVGQETAKPQDTPPPEKPAASAEKKPAEKAEPAKEKNIDETVKEFQKLPGLFTFYH